MPVYLAEEQFSVIYDSLNVIFEKVSITSAILENLITINLAMFLSLCIILTFTIITSIKS